MIFWVTNAKSRSDKPFAKGYAALCCHYTIRCQENGKAGVSASVSRRYRLKEALEQRVRPVGTALELGMELAA